MGLLFFAIPMLPFTLFALFVYLVTYAVFMAVVALCFSSAEGVFQNFPRAGFFIRPRTNPNFIERVRFQTITMMMELLWVSASCCHLPALPSIRVRISTS